MGGGVSPRPQNRLDSAQTDAQTPRINHSILKPGIIRWVNTVFSMLLVILRGLGIHVGYIILHIGLVSTWFNTLFAGGLDILIYRMERDVQKVKCKISIMNWNETKPSQINVELDVWPQWRQPKWMHFVFILHRVSQLKTLIGKCYALVTFLHPSKLNALFVCLPAYGLYIMNAITMLPIIL